MGSPHFDDASRKWGRVHNGTVKATGLDVNGRLGLGNPNSKTTTVRYLQTVPTTVEISEIAVGRSHVLYLGKNKVLYGIGEQANHLKALAGTKGMNNVTELQEFGSEIAEIASSYGSFV